MSAWLVSLHPGGHACSLPNLRLLTNGRTDAEMNKGEIAAKWTWIEISDEMNVKLTWNRHGTRPSRHWNEHAINTELNVKSTWNQYWHLCEINVKLTWNWHEIDVKSTQKLMWNRHRNRHWNQHEMYVSPACSLTVETLAEYYKAYTYKMHDLFSVSAHTTACCYYKDQNCLAV